MVGGVGGCPLPFHPSFFPFLFLLALGSFLPSPESQKKKLELCMIVDLLINVLLQTGI